MKKTTEKSNSLYMERQMKYNWTFNYVIIMVMILLSSNMSLACGVCGPCYSGSWPNCTYVGCQPACDSSSCLSCKADCSGCENWCPSGTTCCNGGCCDPDYCQECVDGQCQVCGGDPNMECCNGICCDLSNCEFCCNGSCCDVTNCEICKNNNTCIRAVPTNMHQDAVVDMGSGVLRFLYSWESTTGDLDDLGNCTVGEKVDYPGSGPFYYWPYPPWTESNPNPTIMNGPASKGWEIDTHYHGYLSPPYQNAGFAANQIYQYHCGPSCCMENDEYETLLDIGSILRFVTGEGDLWRYSIIKSGVYAEYFPLP